MDNSAAGGLDTAITYIAAGGGVIIAGLIPLAFRVVVPTNAVHIVQSGRATTSYGRGQKAGNVYYRWPGWVPVIGRNVSVLPMSVFDLKLDDYAAYDKDRVPFKLDVLGFFRIEDSNVAAERVLNFGDLREQLQGILKGALRSVLASAPIDEILSGRAVFGEKFTNEVTEQLKQWGVGPVKSIELMDIRDSEGSQVIAQIMAKKKSFIEMESRTEVAKNSQAAQIAEITAARQVGMSRQEAEEIVGKRTAEKTQAVGIAGQKAEQAVQGEAAVTTQAKMAVKQVEVVRAAEIDRQAALIIADRDKQAQQIDADKRKGVAITMAEAGRQQKTLDSEGALAAALNNASAIKAEGEAKATAEQLMLTAPVNAQITLAKEIGGNQGYQSYLVSVKQIEANQAVGEAQAKALESANVRIVATASDPAQGLTLAKLGSLAGAAVEAFRATEGAGIGERQK